MSFIKKRCVVTGNPTRLVFPPCASPQERNWQCQWRHPPSPAPLLAPDGPASPASTAVCPCPTARRRADAPVGRPHPGRPRSQRPRRPVRAPQARRPRSSRSRRSCAQRAVSSARPSSGWACTASRAVCSSTRTSSALTSSRPGEALFLTPTLALALALALTLVTPFGPSRRRWGSGSSLQWGQESPKTWGSSQTCATSSASTLGPYLPYICLISPIYLPHISLISRHISPHLTGTRRAACRP